MNEGKSINWVIGALVVVIALFGWGYMAGLYATNVEEFQADPSRRLGQTRRGAAMGEFIGNGFRQIPNAPAVLSSNFSKQLWLPIVIVVLEAGAIGGGFVMKRVEQNLNAPVRQRR